MNLGVVFLLFTHRLARRRDPEKTSDSSRFFIGAVDTNENVATDFNEKINRRFVLFCFIDCIEFDSRRFLPINDGKRCFVINQSDTNTHSSRRYRLLATLQRCQRTCRAHLSLHSQTIILGRMPSIDSSRTLLLSRPSNTFLSS